MSFLGMNRSDLTVFHRLKDRIRTCEGKILDCH